MNATLHMRLARTEEDLRACYPVMVQLRGDFSEDDFVAQVQRQMQHGYHLALGEDAAGVAVVAGFVMGEKLAWGRHLYVDDLVTDARRRSRGAGRAMLDWLKAHAREAGCAQLHLDSGHARTEAHRFYEREGLLDTSRHFRWSVTGPADDDGFDDIDWADPSHEQGLDDGRLE